MREQYKPIDRVISEFALFVTHNEKSDLQDHVWLTKSIPLEHARTFLPKSVHEKLRVGRSSKKVDGKFYWHKTSIDPDIAAEFEVDSLYSPLDFASAVKRRSRSHDHFFGVYLPTTSEDYCAFHSHAIRLGLHFLGFRWLDDGWYLLFGELDSRIQEIRSPDFCRQLTTDDQIRETLGGVAKPFMLGRLEARASEY